MSDLAEEVFGTHWAELSLEVVQRFFADPDTGEEGLTWEVKGGKFEAHHVRKTACAFANSERGGMLVLGVSGGKSDPWLVDGMEIDGEPSLRVGSIVRKGLAPTPSHALHGWAVGNGRTVLVLRIDPVASPPSVTSHGHVYERVSGESLPVRDPVRLAALFERGQEARHRAERHAWQHAEELADYVAEGPHQLVKRADDPTMDYSDMLSAAGSDPRFGLALTALSYPEDVTARLFSGEFRELVERHVAELRASNWPLPVGMLPRSIEYYRQECAFIAGDATTPGGSGYSIALGGIWDGSAAYGWVRRDGDDTTSRLTEDEIAPAWNAALELVRFLGGSGEARLAIVIPETDSWLHGPRGDDLVLERAVDLEAPTTGLLEGIGREIRRAAGMRADEPAIPS